jgi:TrmH family RNA methyltransferase
VPTCAFDEVSGTRIALVPRGGTSLAEVELAGPVVFLLGAEREGLPPDVHADIRASIPQAEGAESLNVAAAGAIALYERRRR